MDKKISYKMLEAGSHKIGRWAVDHYLNRIWGIPKGGTIVSVLATYGAVKYAGKDAIRLEVHASRADILSGTLIVDDVVRSGKNMQNIIRKMETARNLYLHRKIKAGKSVVRTAQPFKTACLFYDPRSVFEPDFYVHKLKPTDRIVFPFNLPKRKSEGLVGQKATKTRQER